jgi:hypothetical protein
MNPDQIVARITERMKLDEFLRIQERLAYLRKEEEDKLKALAELQAVYVSANSDEQREMVKQTVGQIRELSRKTREEIRSLNSTIHQHMELSEARELYEQYLLITRTQSPK